MFYSLLKRIKKFFSDRQVVFLLLFLVGWRLCFYLFYFTVNHPPDSGAFMDLGRKMLTFNLSGYTGERSPGFPALIMLGLGHVKLTILYQFFVGILTGCIWFRTFCKIGFSLKLSFTTTVLLQAMLSIVMYENLVLAETILLFFVSLIFYYTTDYYNRSSKKLDIFMGFLFFYLVLIKPFFIFLPFVFYGFVVIKKNPIKQKLGTKLLTIIFPMIAFLGWSYVNKINTGYFVSTTFFGLNVAQNCVYFAEKTTEEYNWIGQPYAKHRDLAIQRNDDPAMAIWFAYNAGEFSDKQLNFPDLSNELGEYGKATIALNPYEYAKQVQISWIDFWNVSDLTPYFQHQNKSVEETFFTVDLIQRKVMQTMKILFLVSALFFMTKFLITRKINFEIIVVATVLATSILQALVVYGTNSRYSFPFEFLMVVVNISMIKVIVAYSKRSRIFQR